LASEAKFIDGVSGAMLAALRQGYRIAEEVDSVKYSYIVQRFIYSQN
jgi:hypothetical protein